MNCKICNSNNIQFLFSAKGCALKKCVDCHFVFVDPLPSDEEINSIYENEYFDKGKYIDDFATIMEYKRRGNLISKCDVVKNSKILDFGCASGEFVNYLKNDYNIKGIDFSNNAIDIAKKKYFDIENSFYYYNQLEELDDDFDIIVLWDVIEHVKYPLETILLLKQHLKKDGIIILSTPNIGASISKVMKSKWAFMTPPEHLCFFDKKSMNTMIEKTNGKIDYWETKGKWVNLAFLFYKVKRIFPKLIPQFLIDFIKKYFNKISLYIPTNDIQYTIFKFKGKK